MSRKDLAGAGSGDDSLDRRDEGNMNLIGLLKEMNVLCRDNGRTFTDTRRLDVIEEKLRETGYICEKGNLFRLYSKKPVREIDGRLLLVSSHADCEKKISKCFSERETPKKLRGTYDNSITNTAILSLMIEGSLPEQVVVAFTGDEEISSRGAAEVTNYLKGISRQFRAVILDVTNCGWKEKADFTIENDFWEDGMGKAVCTAAVRSGYPWLFVPEKPSDPLPEYIPEELKYPEEAEEDESWEYDEHKIECFSLCLPVKGKMHSDKGTLVREASFSHYVEMLQNLCITLTDSCSGTNG